MRVKKDSRNFLISLKCSLQKLWNFLHAGKKSFWGSMFSLMTLQNSMDERKLKNYQAFHLSLLSSMSVCICVCVCAGPALCVWSGMEGAVFSVWQWGGLREGEGERDRQTWLAEIVFTLWPESDGNRTALPNRVLQIHRYTESVLRQNTADPSHIYNSSRPGETSVSARRTQDLLCVCCSICVSLSPQKRRHPVCPELMFPAHVDYIMTYYPLYYLNVYFACINLILYLI